MSARCLRCGAGNEWIEGEATIKAEPDDEAVRILTELVALKALKDQDWMSYDEKIDYSKRKPLAWEAARAYLARKK